MALLMNIGATNYSDVMCGTYANQATYVSNTILVNGEYQLHLNGLATYSVCPAQHGTCVTVYWLITYKI